MTLISLQLLAHFLNKFKPKGRIADFGGTDKIGGNIVRQMIAMKDISVKNSEPDNKLNVLLSGSGYKKTPPEYIVLDYDNGVDLMKPVKGAKFDAGICMDLLEHTKNPFIIAKNISDSLKSGALLFLTVPFVWELHDYPGDYWRFCPHGLEQLFPKMKAITIEVIRDSVPEEELPRTRLVAIFKKK